MSDAVNLTPKQEAFAQAYLETGCASEAYRRAYDAGAMSDPSVHREACRLLRHPKIAPRIDTERDALMVKHNITQSRVLSELARIAFANMSDYITTTDDGSAYIDLSLLTPDQAAAVAEVTSEVYVEGKGEDAKQVKRTKLKLSDKRSALVDLGRHLGTFKSVIEVEHKGTITFEHRMREALRRAKGAVGAEPTAVEAVPHAPTESETI